MTWCFVFYLVFSPKISGFQRNSLCTQVKGHIHEKKPAKVDVEEGKTYAWCACGRSKKQVSADRIPFADSDSHVLCQFQCYAHAWLSFWIDLAVHYLYLYDASHIFVVLAILWRFTPKRPNFWSEAFSTICTAVLEIYSWEI